jgi:Fe-S cluster assembly scaffold protein SufB
MKGMPTTLNPICAPKGVEVFSKEQAQELFGFYLDTLKETNFDFFVFIPKGVQVDESLKFRFPANLHVYVSKNASLQVEIQPISSGEYTFDAFLEEGANLKRTYIAQDLETIILKSRYALHDFSQLHHISYTESVEKTQESIVASIVGQQADANLIGGWELSDRQTIDVKVLVEHKKGHSRSNQLFKGVVQQSAKSMFEGSIYVEKGAHKTESYQKNNNVVFDQAQAKTSPGIQVYHDDVKASHGATIAKPSKEDLFYLVSRGIDENRAKTLLKEAFLGEIKSMF